MLLLLILGFSLLIIPQQAEARRVVRAGIYNFKPLVYSDESGAPQGFFVKMLNQVAERENWEVQYVPGTWQATLDHLKNNQVDLIMCVGYTEARATFMDFPDEFLVLDWGVVYKGKGSSINTIMDLEGKTVTGLKGSVYSAGFLDLIKQFQIKVNFVEMDQVTDVFKSVESGQAQAGITSNIPGILNEASHSVDRTPIIFTPVKLGFAVNKGTNRDLIEALDRNISEMKGDQRSSYYHELEHIFGHDDSAIPEQVYWAFAGITGGLILAVSFIVALRRKVRQKTAELKQQANLMGAIINGTTDAVFIKDTLGRYVVVNDEVVRLFNRPRSEILGWDDTHFFPAEEAEFLMSTDRAIMAANEVATKEEHITTLEQQRVYLATKGPVYDKSGALAGMFGISRDITALRQAEKEKQLLEQQMQHAQRLESLGVLSGGIAHDFNNILAVILGHCCLAQMDPHRAEASLTEIERAAERAADLCRQMLAYAGKAQFVQVQLNFRELVDEMAKMLKPTISQKASIRLEYAADIPPIYGDASQLRQIVMNLIINASEAIGKEQGEIRVALAKSVLRKGGAERDHLGKAIPAGSYLCLEVSDNGCGMDEETKRRIFEPFYTTKFTGRGLGMSAVLGIIVAHNGALQFTSQEGRGTTFKIYLPLQGDLCAAQDSLKPGEAPAPWLSRGTVLLVEDEEQVRLIAKAMLQSFGFSVLEAGHGGEALELHRKHSREIRMVVTDMGMPVMDGYDLVQELKKIAPGLPIVVTSGFGDAELSSRIAPEDIAATVGKPYNMAQFREVLKKVVS